MGLPTMAPPESVVVVELKKQTNPKTNAVG